MGTTAIENTKSYLNEMQIDQKSLNSDRQRLRRRPLTTLTDAFQRQKNDFFSKTSPTQSTTATATVVAVQVVVVVVVVGTKLHFFVTVFQKVR